MQMNADGKERMLVPHAPILTLFPPSYPRHQRHPWFNYLSFLLRFAAYCADVSPTPAGGVRL
jgi:hypothetical protein